MSSASLDFENAPPLPSEARLMVAQGRRDGQSKIVLEWHLRGFAHGKRGWLIAEPGVARREPPGAPPATRAATSLALRALMTPDGGARLSHAHASARGETAERIRTIARS